MRNILTINPNDDWSLDVTFEGGEKRRYDVKPLLQVEAFGDLQDINMFRSIRNCGYFVEWQNEADLSADTLYIDGVLI